MYRWLYIQMNGDKRHCLWDCPSEFVICCESLTHWGQVTHICVSKLTIIGSDNGLSPSRHQAIIWTYAGILLIRPWGTSFSAILIEIDVFWLKKMHLRNVGHVVSASMWPRRALGRVCYVVSCNKHIDIVRLSMLWQTCNCMIFRWLATKHDMHGI